MIIFCLKLVFFFFFVLTSLANLLVIRALWKASSVRANLKRLFLNLAVSDFAVGLFSQLMIGVIIAVMLHKKGSET